MNCDSFFERYCLLDKDEPLPIPLKVHIIRCKACKETAKRMVHAEKMQRHILAASSSDERLLSEVMRSIQTVRPPVTSSPYQDVPPGLLPWLAAGLFMLAGVIVIPFISFGKIGLQQFGDSFLISFAILSACSISAYSAVFFAKHRVFFTEKFERRV